MKRVENEEGTFMSAKMRREDLPKEAGFEIRARIERARPNALHVGVLGHWRDDATFDKVCRTAQAAVAYLLQVEGASEDATAVDLCTAAIQIAQGTIAALYLDGALRYGEEGWGWSGAYPPTVGPEVN